MAALHSMAVYGLGAVLVGLTLSLTAEWDVAALCPGSADSAPICGRTWWALAAENLATWLVVGQLLVIAALGSPLAVLRLGR